MPGFDGFQTLSNRKGVYFQPRWAPLNLLRPPYSAAARRVISFLLRWG
jgi:hypothetical protein